MGRNKGICAICGRGGKLSFEHVPAQAAGNEPDVIVYSITDWLARDVETGKMSGGHPQPEGTGSISICGRCNGYAGEHYVPHFARFVSAGLGVLYRLGEDTINAADLNIEPLVVEFGVQSVRPLAVAKQIVASLLALNAPTVAQANPELVNFVLDRTSTGLPTRYRLYLSLYTGPIGRFVGLAMQIDTVTGHTVLMTECAYPPFAYLLTLDSEPRGPVGEITEWTTREADTVTDERLRLTLAFGHTPYPGDYRSMARVKADR